MTAPINSTLPPNTQNSAAQPKQQNAPIGAGAERQPVAVNETQSGTRPPVASVVQEAPRQSAQELAEATRNITDYIQTVSRSLNISVDSDLGTTVIKVLDAETEELVRQIPAEEILQLARFLSDQQASSDQAASLRGLLIDQEG